MAVGSLSEKLNEKGGIYKIVIFAFLIVIGFLLNILAAAIVEKNFFPIFTSICFVLAPIPNLLFGGGGSNDVMSTEEGGHQDIGFFLTSVFAVSGLAFPIVFYHTEVMSDAGMIMTVIGGLITYATIIAYVKVFHSDNEDGMY